MLHVSTVHPAFDTRIYERQCRSLAAAGYRVRFLVPHHGSPPRDSAVEIVPLKQYTSRLARVVLGGPRTLLACLRQRADLTCVHDPELIPLALCLKLLGRRAVYDAHEDYVAYFRGHPRLPRMVRHLLAAAMRPLEALAGRFLDFVVVATPAIGRRFPEAKRCLVQNFPDVPDASSDLEGRTRSIAYLGELNEERGARELLDALSELQEKGTTTLAFAGRIRPEALRDELERHEAWPFVKDHGWVGPEEVVRLLAGCRVGVVPFKPLPNHVESQPRKLFEYMAAGLPVVASDFPLWRTFLEETGAGLTCAVEPHALAATLERLLENPEDARRRGLLGHEAARRQFSWQSQTPTLLAAYEKALTD
ncbi:MAG: glycosyltransferase [Acidobacteriota bacterium]